jgi:hypothetical protein
MANISDAYGSVRLEGDWGRDEAIMLAYFIDAAWVTKGDYGMYVADSTLDVADHLLNDRFTFSGSGRWNFENTLIDAAEHLEPYGSIVGEGRTITVEEFNSMYLLLAKTMKEKHLKFTVEYADMETGSDFIGEGYVVFESTGTQILPGENNFNELDTSLTNRINLFSLTESDVNDIIYSGFDCYEGDHTITPEAISELALMAMSGKLDFPMSPWFDNDDYISAEVLEVIKKHAIEI